MWLGIFATMTRTKLIPLSRVRPKLEIDTVKESKQFGERRAFDVLFPARTFYVLKTSLPACPYTTLIFLQIAPESLPKTGFPSARTHKRKEGC